MIANKKLYQAEKGSCFWIKNSLYQFDYILFLPHNDTRLNLLLCDAFEKKLGEESVIGSDQKALVLSVEQIRESELYIYRIITGDLADSILTLYGMYKFTDKLIIGSLELPYGRKIRNLLTCDIDSEKDLLDSIIF